MKIAALIILSILLCFHSCSSHRDMSGNQVSEGHYRLYSFPEKPKEYFESSPDERYQDIIFAVINDTKGRVHPNKTLVVDPARNTNLSVDIGGVNGYKAYLKILREKFPNQVQVVSSGSFISEEVPLSETLFYYNYLELNAAGLSREEFSLPFNGDYIKRLDRSLSGANFKIISSNIFSLEQAEDFQLENILQSSIVEEGDLKVGYISLVSPTMAKTFDSQKLNKVYFTPMAPKIITLANELKKKGADIIALMVSHGLDCTSQQSQGEEISPYKVNFYPKNEKVCELYDNELKETLAKLPPAMVDIVFTNGVSSKVANFIGGYPVLQSFSEGEHMSWAKLVYDTKFKRVVKDKTQIMQPAQICHQFFKETQDCYTKEVLRNIELVPAVFLGEEVKVEELPTRK